MPSCAMSPRPSATASRRANRVSHRHDGLPQFGGVGFAYSPGGELLQETSEESPCISVPIDLDLVRRAQHGYPCYVAELGEELADGQ